MRVSSDTAWSLRNSLGDVCQDHLQTICQEDHMHQMHAGTKTGAHRPGTHLYRKRLISQVHLQHDKDPTALAASDRRTSSSPLFASLSSARGRRCGWLTADPATVCIWHGRVETLPRVRCPWSPLSIYSGPARPLMYKVIPKPAGLGKLHKKESLYQLQTSSAWSGKKINPPSSAR